MLYRAAKWGVLALRHRRGRRVDAERRQLEALEMQARLRAMGLGPLELPAGEEPRPGVVRRVRAWRYRHRMLLRPVLLVAVLWPAGAAAPQVPVGGLVVAWAVAAAVWWLARRRRLTRPAERWYALVCWVTVLVWLLVARAVPVAALDLPWVLVAAAVAVPWLVHHWPRERVEVPEPVEVGHPFAEAWDRYIAAPGRKLAGAELVACEVGDHYTLWRIALVRGVQTLEVVEKAVPQIASATGIPAAQLLPEGDPTDEDPGFAVLKVLHQPPREDITYVTDPIVDENGRIPLGPHIDNDGWASVRLYDEATGSMYGGSGTGDSGSGKSRMFEGFAVAVRRAWVLNRIPTAVIYLDGQRGASSPLLWKNATLSVTPELLPVFFECMRDAAAIRQAYNRRHGLQGFRPGRQPRDPDTGELVEGLTGLLLVADEFHALCGKNGPWGQEWRNIVTEDRKLGVAVWEGDQALDLSVFGQNDALRAGLFAGNGISYRIGSVSAGSLVPGMPMNPGKLPAVPGYGMRIAAPGSPDRAACFRNAYMPSVNDKGELPDGVKTVEEWFAETEDAPIDSFTMRALTPLFEAVAEHRESSGAADLALLEGREVAVRERVEVSRPTLAAVPARKRSSRDTILEVLREQATATRKELIERTGVSPSAVTQVLRSLRDGGDIEVVGEEGSGVYQLTSGGAAPSGLAALRAMVG